MDGGFLIAKDEREQLRNCIRALLGKVIKLNLPHVPLFYLEEEGDVTCEEVVPPRLEHLTKLLGGLPLEVVMPLHLPDIFVNCSTAFVLCIKFVIGRERQGMGKG